MKYVYIIRKPQFPEHLYIGITDGSEAAADEA